jgi:hypothetical protein
VSEAKKQDNFRLRRNPKGEIYHLDGVSPTLGIAVKVRPLTYGESRGMASFAQPILKWSNQDKFFALTTNLIEPKLELESIDDMLENFDAWTIEDLVQAVAVYCGLARLYGDDSTEGNEVGEAEQEPEES